MEIGPINVAEICKNFSSVLLKFYPFGLFILVLGIPAIIHQTSGCYATRGFETRVYPSKLAGFYHIG